MGWKLHTQNNSVTPPIESSDDHESEQAALKAAWELMYGPTSNRQVKALRIEGPNGQRIDSQEIEKWCEAYSRQ
jgi:hypothetical protein